MKEAEQAREILKAYDIDLNSAANGVLLPSRNDNYVVLESLHSGGHTNAYCQKVTKRLSGVIDDTEGQDDDTIRKALCDELTNIKIDLFKGIISVTDKE